MGTNDPLGLISYKKPSHNLSVFNNITYKARDYKIIKK